jgi:hypothetical protein
VVLFNIDSRARCFLNAISDSVINNSFEFAVVESGRVVISHQLFRYLSQVVPDLLQKENYIILESLLT